jgi:proteasome inhibitor subunit 1 (PI31)
LEFLLKVSKLGNRTLFNAIALEVRRLLHLNYGSFLIRIAQDDKTASLDISTNDFISPSFFPHEIGAAPLVHGFISSNRIADLMSQFKLKIVSRILPALRKEGYVEQSEAASTSERAAAAQPPPDNQPGARPRAENPPYAPDHPGPYPYNPHIPPENPFAIGRRDLDPIPMNPFSPPSLFPPNNREAMVCLWDQTIPYLAIAGPAVKADCVVPGAETASYHLWERLLVPGLIQ